MLLLYNFEHITYFYQHIMKNLVLLIYLFLSVLLHHIVNQMLYLYIEYHPVLNIKLNSKLFEDGMK